MALPITPATGGADGCNLFHNPREETHIYARRKPLREGQPLATVPAGKKAEFQLYKWVKKF